MVQESDKPLFLFVHIYAKEGESKTVGKLLEGLITPSLAEKGCQEYLLHRSRENENLYIVYEIWETEEDFEGHQKTAHFLDTFAKLEDLLQSVEPFKANRLPLP